MNGTASRNHTSVQGPEGYSAVIHEERVVKVGISVGAILDP